MEFRHIVKRVLLPIRRVTKAERDEAERKIIEAVSRMDKANFDYSDNAVLYVYAGTVARYETQNSVPEIEIDASYSKNRGCVVSQVPLNCFFGFRKPNQSAESCGTNLFDSACWRFARISSD